MRVLLLNQVFYPDVAATAQHAHDLARHLVAHGHEVHAIASRSLYGAKGAALPRHEIVDGISVHRVGKSLFGKAGIAARVADFGLFYVAATLKALTIRRPDVVICFTTPPFIALVGWLMRLVRRSRFVYWVMDLYPDLPIACGLMKPGSLLARFFESVNRFCLRRADRTVVLGRCMEDRVRAKGIDGAHLVRIGVWADQDEVRPIDRATNPYRRTWGLGDRFVVMYSGNLGLAHDADTMCRAALALASDDAFRFVVVGGGKKQSDVERFVAEHRLENVVLAPYQPRENLDASLSCADVHIATVLEGLEGMVVPCKLAGIMAAARPTIFIGDPSSELARVLVEHDCGICVRQGDVEGLVEAIRVLAGDPARGRELGDRAREALRTAYSRQQECEAWRRMLEELVSAAPGSESTVETAEPHSTPDGGASC